MFIKPVTSFKVEKTSSSFGCILEYLCPKVKLKRKRKYSTSKKKLQNFHITQYYGSEKLFNFKIK